jgi:uncharacterized BrkB/YihY/UPF0761 family membrane protein
MSNIAAALRRMITFPAAHNSLNDLLGEQAAHVVASVVHDAISQAVGNALVSVAIGGVSSLSTIQEHVQTEVFKVLRIVPKELAGPIATQINSTLATAITNAEMVTVNRIPGIVEDLTAKLSGILKLS